MNKVYVLAILLFYSFLLHANEDSIIVYSLLEQAKATENTDSAKVYSDKAMSYSQKNNYMDGVLSAAKHYGNQYAKTGELEKSIDLYLKILNEHKFNNLQLSTAYNQIGIYHVYMGHYDSTEIYFLKALKMREQLRDSIGIGASLNNLGNVLMSKGDYDKSINYFFEALKIREQINDTNGIASTTNNLGMIYYKQQSFNEAINYYRKALFINQKQKNISKEILILLNLGNIYDEMMQLDSSVYYYKIAIEKAEDFGEARFKSMAYGNMGVTQDKLKNYDLAKSYFRKALKIRVESNDLEGQAIIYNNLGAVYVATNQYDSAVYYFKKSLVFSEQIDYKECTRDNYLGLSDAYEKQGNFKAAFSAHQNYETVKDSMLNETTNEQIAELKTRYETEKKEKAIAEQKAQISLQQLKVKQRNYILVGVAILLLAILLIGAFIYRHQKQKQLQLIEENKLKDEIAQVQLQNKLHEERLIISNGLNENIGSQLSFIISSIDNIKHQFQITDDKLNKRLSDIGNFTKTTITQLRDTIWALNKDSISFEDLKMRLYNYLEQAKLAQDHTKFNFEAQLKSSLRLNAIQGVSIYRVVQEAINNSMKYAAATNIILEITENTNSICLAIIDDGIGFNMAEIQLGNGLENMRNRASSINADFQINSTPQKGTKITLEIDKSEFNT